MLKSKNKTYAKIGLLLSLVLTVIAFAIVTGPIQEFFLHNFTNSSLLLAWKFLAGAAICFGLSLAFLVMKSEKYIYQVVAGLAIAFVCYQAMKLVHFMYGLWVNY